MRVSYDPKLNIAYIRLRAKGEEVQAIKVSEDLVIDLAPDGSVYGFELLNADEQLRGGDADLLVLVNEATGKKREFSLAELDDA